jgi:predicted DNA-binding transcriptional regulator AlpA
MEVMTYKQVSEWLGIDVTTIKRWVYSGVFPKPMRISYRISKFDKADIVNWLEKKKEVQKSDG